MTLQTPGGPSVRQWEAHVRQMIRRGSGREEIVYAMTSANWAFDDADALIRKIAGGERWRAAATMIGGAALVLVFAGLSFVALTSPGGGMIWYGPCFFGAGLFIYGIVRLARMRV